MARGRFDDCLCIISDLHLPGENGLQILSGLRAAAIATPVFLITGRAGLRVREEARRLGSLAVYEKPVSARELVTAIAAIGDLPASS